MGATISISFDIIEILEGPFVSSDPKTLGITRRLHKPVIRAYIDRTYDHGRRRRRRPPPLSPVPAAVSCRACPAAATYVPYYIRTICKPASNSQPTDAATYVPIKIKPFRPSLRLLCGFITPTTLPFSSAIFRTNFSRNSAQRTLYATMRTAPLPRRRKISLATITAPDRVGFGTSHANRRHALSLARI